MATDGMPVMTPRESVWDRKEVNGLFCMFVSDGFYTINKARACLRERWWKVVAGMNILTYEEDGVPACGALVVL